VVQNLVFRLGCVFVDAAVFWKLWKSESGRNQKARFSHTTATTPPLRRETQVFLSRLLPSRACLRFSEYQTECHNQRRYTNSPRPVVGIHVLPGGYGRLIRPKRQINRPGANLAAEVLLLFPPLVDSDLAIVHGQR
jgi:hypothetical protein